MSRLSSPSLPLAPLAALAAEINRESALAERAWSSALEHAIRAGELLLRAKAQVKHGEWLPWLDANFKGSARTAQGYMRLARYPDPQALADLGLEAALRKIARPAPQCWHVGVGDDGPHRTLSADGVEIYVANVGDVATLRLGEAAAVITDPPYGRQALPLWGELVRFCDRVLGEHGWMLAMSGQRWLPETLAALERAAAGTSMRYCWTLAVHTPGGQTAQGWIAHRNALNTEWKPVLVYAKGEPACWPEGFRDVLFSPGRDKSHHRWGQALAPFETLVECFSEAGELVVDPFVGGGTTAEAACTRGRAFEGFDIDPVSVTTAAERASSYPTSIAFKRGLEAGAVGKPTPGYQPPSPRLRERRFQEREAQNQTGSTQALQR